MTEGFTDDDIISFVRSYEQPCVTSTEVSQEFGVNRDTARKRLNSLMECGRLGGKRIGAAAKVWWARG